MEMKREELTRTAGAAFEQLMQTYQFCMQRVLSKYGLYPGQPALLFAISAADKPTQNDLAQTLGVSKASVGVSLRRMEKAGFVKRVRDRKDTRCIRIALTQKGQEFTRWCRIDYDMLYTTLLEGFSGEERNEALGMIQTMYNSLAELRGRLES